MRIQLLYASGPGSSLNGYHYTDRELGRLSEKVVYACGCVDCLEQRGKVLRLRGFKVVLEESDETSSTNNVGAQT